MPQIFVSVREKTPKPWGSDEWDWRERLAEEAKKVRASHPKVEQLPNSGKTIEFGVQIVFLMKADKLGRADLDNLAKPVLDTLFRPRNAQVKDKDKYTGALFNNVDDDRVFKLKLEKKLVSTEKAAGVDVTIDW